MSKGTRAAMLFLVLAPVLFAAMASEAADATPPNTGDFNTPFTRALVTDNAAPPSRSIGKLALRFPNGTGGECSAEVVDAPNRSTVMTAGHCVYSKSKGGVATSGSFVPAYHDGVAPYGQWQSISIVPSGPWVLSGHSHFDFAFVVLAPANRRYVEDVVGGLPIGFNQPRDQAYRLLGYPVEPNPPFNGGQLWRCDSTYGGDAYDPDPDEQYGPPLMYTGCDLGHGASGGPWLNPSGVVSSVVTTFFGSGAPNIIGGPYLGDYAQALFAQVGNTPVALPAARCKKHRKGKHKRSAYAAKKKKCGGKHHRRR